MESTHSISSLYPNMKLKPLSSDDIQDYNNEMESIYELPFKLFPSPYQVSDIMGYSDDDFFHHLETIEQSDRIATMCKLFLYCSELRRSQALLGAASSLHAKCAPLGETIRRLKQEMASDETSTEKADEISNCERLLTVIDGYKMCNDIDWMFVIIARFMKNHIDSFATEQLLWSFCSQYFENDDLEELASRAKDDAGAAFEVAYNYEFPYKLHVPINAQVAVKIDGVEFTECVEVSVLHFFYMCQPYEPHAIMKYWDGIESPVNENVKAFFRLQGPKRCNNKNVALRTIWADILSRIPGLIYRKRTEASPCSNDVEIAAAWFNYVKAIAYVKNDKDVWKEMCECGRSLTEKGEIFPLLKKSVCECFKKLAGDKMKSSEWVENGPYEGIRYMDDGSLDLLGTIRCSFEGVSEKIDFVMQDGHGFVQWMDMYDDE